MSETKHTPGPWTYNAEGRSVLDAKGNSVIVKKNGYIISATPDMLAILQELAETVPMSIQQRTRVDAVIRKATQY